MASIIRERATTIKGMLPKGAEGKPFAYSAAAGDLEARIA
jgi:hypothetical protein